MNPLLLAALALTPLVSPPAAAAGCTEESARSAPGTWTSRLQPDLETSDIIPKGEIPGVLKEMSGYADLLKAALGGNAGHKAVWYRSLGGRLFHDGPAKYETIVPLYRFECDDGKPGAEDEYSELASVAVNSTWNMSGPSADIPINGKKHYSFGSPIGEIRGFPAYQTDITGFGNSTKWVVLVTRPGKLHAFHLATRREVLDSLKAQTAKDWAERRAAIKDEAALARMRKQEAKTLARLDAVRARYAPAQLEETAQAHPSAMSLAWDDFDFKKTHEEACGKGVCGDGWGRPFALPVRSYYDLTGSVAKPQFFTVTFQWSGRGNQIDPAVAKLRDDFFARFDFDALVARLGKEKENP